MAVLSRYANQSTFEVNGSVYARRQKRLSKDREYFVITTNSRTTLDVIALQQYGSPLLYWMIADFNDMLDPTVVLPVGTKLKIPRM